MAERGSAFSPRVYESRTTLLFLPPLPAEIDSEESRSVVLTPDTYFTLATAEDLLHDVAEAAYRGAAGEDMPSVAAMRRSLTVKLAESSEKAQGVPDQMAMSVSFRAREPEEAMKVLDDALKIDPKYAEAYRLKGIAQLQLKQNAEACESFAKAKELGDPNVDSLISKHCK